MTPDGEVITAQPHDEKQDQNSAGTEDAKVPDVHEAYSALLDLIFNQQMLDAEHLQK